VSGRAMRRGAAVAAARVGLAALGAWGGGALVSGCASEDKILKYKPFFTNVQGAVTATPAVGVEASGDRAASATAGESPVPANGEPVNPDAVAESYYDKLAKLPDHLVTLEAGDIGTLVHHVRWTLDTDRDRVLIDQLLAEELISELRSRGQTPDDYVDWLHENRRDVEIMLARMPMFERSPTVVYEQTAKHTYRVRLTGAAERGVKFTQLWVSMERGRYRLLWIS
jgi:hypothetical protein